MKIFAILVIILIIIAAISTIAIAGRGDEKYSSSTKRNTTNLTLIYVITIPLSLVALAVFIIYFT